MIIQGKVWGYTTPLFNKNNVELHIAEVKKGGYCSKHMHKYKFNRFIVLKGKLQITIWKDYGNGTTSEDISILGISQECTVAPNEYHKFEALEDTTVLEVYWVELNDNDIVRVDHGGMLNEAKADIGSTVTGSGDRKAIFVDEYRSPVGTKYFGNENSGHSLR